jgi:hypothetical protein
MEFFDNLTTFTDKAIGFFRISAITGFLATTTLIINLNNQKFHTIFKDRAKKLWWLFLVVSLVLFAVILYIFNIIFQKLNIGGYANLVLDFLNKKI